MKKLKDSDYRTLSDRILQLESERDELIKDNVKSEDHLYRKLLSAQKERDELKGKKFPTYSEWLKKEKLPRDKISRKVYNLDKKECAEKYEVEQELQNLKDAVKEYTKLYLNTKQNFDWYGEQQKLLDKLKELIK